MRKIVGLVRFRHQSSTMRRHIDRYAERGCHGGFAECSERRRSISMALFCWQNWQRKSRHAVACLVVRLLIMLVWNETADRVGVISFWNREPTRHLREDRRRTNLESIGHYTIITMFRSSELHSGQYIRHTFKECTHGIHIVIRPYIFR